MIPQTQVLVEFTNIYQAYVKALIILLDNSLFFKLCGITQLYK